jgi:hypothetical protein
MTGDRHDTRAREIVAEVFDDIRDRRTLKWFFSEQPSKICDHFESIDLDVQEQIRAAWAELIASALREEAERCARIAELPPIGHLILCGDTCDYIAKAIREGSRR